MVDRSDAMETFVQDLRYSLRTPAKAPGYTAVAVLTLALGVGANAAMFSVLQAVVLRDLPYREPDRIEAMAASVRPEFTRNTLGGADTARIQLGVVGKGFFELLAAAPLAGRRAPGLVPLSRFQGTRHRRRTFRRASRSSFTT